MSTDLDIGRLTAADEALNHQIADTFATVVESDRGWTEKIWASIARKDGGLQVDFGLGKYLNRNVMDAFAGVSRGREQWTVRASRVLEPALDLAAVGSIRYEVIEPLKQVRFVLEASATQPIAFDIVFHAEMKAFFEKRNRMRTGNRVRNDLVRYHQGGSVTGWLEVAGERHTLGDDWFAFRDHSWGARGDNVGFLPPDVQPRSAASRMRLLWGAYELQRPDGSRYGISAYFTSNEHWDYFSGHVNEADGTQQVILRIVPEVRLDPNTRHFLGARYTMLMATGETRHLDLARPASTCAPAYTVNGPGRAGAAGAAAITRRASTSPTAPAACTSSGTCATSPCGCAKATRKAGASRSRSMPACSPSWAWGPSRTFRCNCEHGRRAWQMNSVWKPTRRWCGPSSRPSARAALTPRCAT